MTRQEINLYGIEFRREEQPFSFRQILWAAGGFLLVLLLIEGFTVWGIVAGEQQLLLLNEQQQKLTDRLNTIKSSQPISRRPQLEAKIKDLTLQLQRREELKGIIGGQDLGNIKGFSTHLEALARQSNRQLALTNVAVLQGGEYVEIAGWTKNPAAVPAYLQALRGEDAMRPVKFGVLSILQDSNASNKQYFRLGKLGDEK